MLRSISELMRKEAEKCDRLSKLIITTDISGGTGSVSLNYINSIISADYEKINITAFI